MTRKPWRTPTIKTETSRKRAIDLWWEMLPPTAVDAIAEYCIGSSRRYKFGRAEMLVALIAAERAGRYPELIDWHDAKPIVPPSRRREHRPRVCNMSAVMGAYRGMPHHSAPPIDPHKEYRADWPIRPTPPLQTLFRRAGQ